MAAYCQVDDLVTGPMPGKEYVKPLPFTMDFSDV